MNKQATRPEYRDLQEPAERPETHPCNDKVTGINNFILLGIPRRIKISADYAMEKLLESEVRLKPIYPPEDK